MKTILQNTTFLLSGMLLFSACSEEPMGKSPEKIVEELTVEVDQKVSDTIPADSVREDELILQVPPPPEPMPEPLPPGPMPEPIPEPLPEPIGWPVPPPPPAPKPVPYVDFPDVAPIYPGDEPMDSKNMMKFISENIQYPQIDKELGNQGRVYVEFIVEKDGSLTNVKVLRGVSESIDREAVRIVRLMPNWIPGETNGKVARCKARLPITFKLD